jgi:hypothetical protein
VLSPVALSVIVSATIQIRSPSPAATAWPLMVVVSVVFMALIVPAMSHQRHFISFCDQ